ncbi:MAG: HlyD family efflux transporter periplasmic adaptor subunit [Deltaproteobacteria bacterium]|nr:HlyD family efflux transporter periplasmic adaptor subunit [Deltaproteobacteria bacterium]
MTFRTACLPALACLIAALATPALGQDCPETFTARPAVTITSHVGFTRARTAMDIVAETSQKCLEVLSDIGDPVPGDGVFARLDPTFVDLRLRANEAERKRIENRVSHLETEFDRYRRLLEGEQTSQSAFDAREQELDQARLALESLAVDRAVLEEERRRHQVKAPAGWAVMDRRVEPGQWVSSGTVLARVGDMGTLIVPFALAPEEIRLLEDLPGPSLTLPDYGRLRVPASILRISPAFDPQTRKVNVDLVVSEGLPLRREGLRAVLDLPAPDPSGAVLVPVCGLEERYEEHYLLTPEGRAVRVMLLSVADGAARVSSPEVRPGQTFVSPTSRPSQ